MQKTAYVMRIVDWCSAVCSSDLINNLRREGLSRADALVAGSRERLRPILMTMGTTVLGMLPLCFEGPQLGGDGPPYYPMARAIEIGRAAWRERVCQDV